MTRPRGGSPARPALLVAAGCGTVHALATVYWAVGGTWLIETLGARVLEAFDGRQLLLLPVALVKLAGALQPLRWDALGWPRPRLTRTLVALGAALLVLWGGANTVVGNLVLGGVITPDGGYDRPAMVGHAWLWDPLFLVWGVALVVGLLRARRGPGARPR